MNELLLLLPMNESEEEDNTQNQPRICDVM